MMVCEKTSILNETRNFAQSCQGRWIFLLDLELEQDPLYVKNLPSWNKADFFYRSYIIAKKKHFLTFQGNDFTPLNRFYYFRKLVLIACISTIIWFFSHFICHVETREHYQVISENSLLAHRSIRSQETIYLTNISLTK